MKITQNLTIINSNGCINNAIRKKEVNINKYGIKAVRLMYDGDYLKEMIKEYIAGNSMFK